MSNKSKNIIIWYNLWEKIILNQQKYSEGTPEGYKRIIEQEPVGRMGRPGEIADAVLWLCSDAASSATGDAMRVDGGQLVH